MLDPQATLNHLTLNTGHSRVSPRREVSDELIRRLRPLVQENGGPFPGLAGRTYRVVITRVARDAVFTIYSPAELPILTCGLAQTAEGAPHVWDALTRIMDPAWSRRPQVSMPTERPWLGVVLLPTGVTTEREELYWIADFERCVAWTLIEEEG